MCINDDHYNYIMCCNVLDNEIYIIYLLVMIVSEV